MGTHTRRTSVCARILLSSASENASALSSFKLFHDSRAYLCFDLCFFVRIRSPLFGIYRLISPFVWITNVLEMPLKKFYLQSAFSVTPNDLPQHLIYSFLTAALCKLIYLLVYCKRVLQWVTGHSAISGSSRGRTQTCQSTCHSTNIISIIIISSSSSRNAGRYKESADSAKSGWLAETASGQSIINQSLHLSEFSKWPE